MERCIDTEPRSAPDRNRHGWSRLLLASILLWVSCSASPEAQEQPPPPQPSTPPSDETMPLDETMALDETMKGLDVSSHSGSVDWAKVAGRGYGFAFAKATEGMDLKDSAFAAHWPAMRSAGLIRGAYHFYVTEDDPGKQADFFIANVDLEPGDLAPVVDVELIGHNTPSGLADRLQTFLDRLESHYGVKPIVYTSPNFWDANLTDEFGAYPLWVAEYEVDAPRLPKGWSDWDLWQWAEDETVDGVESGADLNRVSTAGSKRSELLVPETTVSKTQ